MKAYCFDQYTRTVARKGVKLEDGTIAYYADNAECMRERCRRDHHYFNQLRDTITKNHNQELSGEPFSLDFIDIMYTVGCDRAENPQHKPMSFEARRRLLEGRSAVSSSQASTGSTVPLNSHPDYQSIRAQSFAKATPRDDQGKGKGKAKGKQEWEWRHGGPYW